eukprot:1316895-Alexandrium_andersonii.AAC.1
MGFVGAVVVPTLELRTRRSRPSLSCARCAAAHAWQRSRAATTLRSGGSVPIQRFFVSIPYGSEQLRL